MRPASDLRLSPIVVPKTSDVLAGELRKQILGGALAPGAALPAERELVTTWQLVGQYQERHRQCVEDQRLADVKARQDEQRWLLDKAQLEAEIKRLKESHGT